jgi:high-affinity Fe2+/Pb2+ permease
MNWKRFLVLFGFTLLLVAVSLFVMSLSDRVGSYIDIGYYAVPAFSLLSVAVFALANILERRKEHQGLFNLVVINVMLKFLITALVIGVYYQIEKPENGVFVIPFILVYVVFTIFEAYFMSEQARTK